MISQYDKSLILKLLVSSLSYMQCKNDEIPKSSIAASIMQGLI